LPDSATALAACGYELGLLKRIRRTGWWHVGVRDPESVAEHTMRVAQMAGLLAAEERQNARQRSATGPNAELENAPTLDDVPMLPRPQWSQFAPIEPRLFGRRSYERAASAARGEFEAALAEYDRRRHELFE
jgi:putative hydrolase of HD superfamily